MIKGRCIIIGEAACVFDDLEKLKHSHSLRGDTVIALNDMILDCPRAIDFGASMLLPFLRSLRRRGVTAPLICPEGRDRGADIVYDEAAFHHGSTGLYAVGFALLRGFEEIVLAGVPMDDSRHYNDPAPFASEQFRRAWIDALPLMRGRVRSISGWTQELLGKA